MKKLNSKIDNERSNLERSIYGLNERLINSEEKWRDINHLLLNTNNPKAHSQPYYSKFLQSNGIKENDLLIDEQLVFVLTPFHIDHFQEYKIIQETCQGIGLNCLRGDEENFMSDIFPAMLKYIVKARLIIANIEGRNPNVMYELGIAQSLDKNVILVAKNKNELPIDLKSKRFILYSNYEELRKKLRKDLLNT